MGTPLPKDTLPELINYSIKIIKIVNNAYIVNTFDGSDDRTGGDSRERGPSQSLGSIGEPNAGKTTVASLVARRLAGHGGVTGRSGRAAAVAGHAATVWEVEGTHAPPPKRESTTSEYKRYI